ncbi:MAG TPA: hypothetical protein DHV62_10355 [Elusimicrobia bacterium]|jgi:hypothetical protein|nr:hypothetical protein [Elusimicrobiota bacterium]
MKTEILSEERLREFLSQFTGTEEYHRTNFGLLCLTDGMFSLCEAAGCYWLIDIVESVQSEQDIKNNKAFIVWRIEVNEDKSFKVTAWSDKPYESELLYEQKGTYTDFPLADFEFYQCDSVLVLKSEY